MKNVITEFGLKRDGVTDNSAKLQAAINTLAQAGGGGLWFPPGTYLLNSPITIPSSNIVLRGAGPKRTTIYIPRSLSDWKPGTFSMNPTTGQVYTAWSYGGAFISFSGSDAVGKKLTTVTADAPRGSTVLQVADTSQIQVGAMVALKLYDPSGMSQAMAAGLDQNTSAIVTNTTSTNKTQVASVTVPPSLAGLNLSAADLEDPIVRQAVLAGQPQGAARLRPGMPLACCRCWPPAFNPWMTL